VVIPFANRNKDQDNPIYTKPPGTEGGCKLVEHADMKLAATEFGEGKLYGKIFLWAKVEYPDYPDPAYINIWQSASMYSPGTLYCALEWDHKYSQQCLCGRCYHVWIVDGWICPMLQWDWLPLCWSFQ